MIEKSEHDIKQYKSFKKTQERLDDTYSMLKDQKEMARLTVEYMETADMQR